MFFHPGLTSLRKAEIGTRFYSKKVCKLYANKKALTNFTS
jgi:hypothetical protein